MSWTAPFSWVAGTVYDKNKFNEQLRDNLVALWQGNQQYCKVYLGSSPSTSNNVEYTISWDKVAFQVGTIFSLGAPTHFTAPQTGKYAVAVTEEWRSNTNALRNLSLVRNAGVEIDLQSQGAAGGKSNVNGYTELLMNAGDWFQVRAFQSSGGSLTLHGGAPDRTRAAVWLVVG